MCSSSLAANLSAVVYSAGLYMPEGGSRPELKPADSGSSRASASVSAAQVCGAHTERWNRLGKVNQTAITSIWAQGGAEGVGGGLLGSGGWRVETRVQGSMLEQHAA